MFSLAPSALVRISKYWVVFMCVRASQTHPDSPHLLCWTYTEHCALIFYWHPYLCSEYMSLALLFLASHRDALGTSLWCVVGTMLQSFLDPCVKRICAPPLHMHRQHWQIRSSLISIPAKLGQSNGFIEWAAPAPSLMFIKCLSSRVGAWQVVGWYFGSSFWRNRR